MAHRSAGEPASFDAFDATDQEIQRFNATADQIRKIHKHNRYSAKERAREPIDLNAKLSASVRTVFAVLLKRINWRQGFAFGGYTGLVRDTGFQRRSCMDAVAKLARIGAILVLKARPGASRRQSNRYTIPGLVSDALVQTPALADDCTSAKGRAALVRSPARGLVLPPAPEPVEFKPIEGNQLVVPDAPRPADKNDLIEKATEAYNAFSHQWGMVPCGQITSSRRALLEQRVSDIGGLANFKRALSMIEHNDFLMGRAPPRTGQKPFQLTLDYLLLADGRMGDVLAQLLDRSNAPMAQRRDDSGLRPGWWRGESQERAARALPADWWRPVLTKHANGTWPVEMLGPGPWDDGCLVPTALIAELGLRVKYPAPAATQPG